MSLNKWIHDDATNTTNGSEVKDMIVNQIQKITDIKLKQPGYEYGIIGLYLGTLPIRFLIGNH